MKKMKRTTILSVVEETGEIVPGVVALKKKRRQVFPEGFSMIARYGSRFVGIDAELTVSSHRVLRILESELDYENWARVCQSEIARVLSMRRQVVNRAIKQLVEKGILLKGKKVGKFYDYKLNPEYCWRGDPWNMDDEIHNIPNSEYMDFRRACLGQDADKRRAKEGLEPLNGGKNIVDFQEEQKRRKKATQLAEKILASNVDFDVLDDFLKNNGTK